LQAAGHLLADLAAAAAIGVGGTVEVSTHLAGYAALAPGRAFPHLGSRIVVVRLPRGAEPAAAAAAAAAALAAQPRLFSMDPWAQGAAVVTVFHECPPQESAVTRAVATVRSRHGWARGGWKAMLASATPGHLPLQPSCCLWPRGRLCLAQGRQGTAPR
jgi:hypothetical protein